MPGTIHLPEGSRRQLESWVTQGYPYETCGLLVGHDRAGDVHIERIEQARNLNTERARDRFELAPQDFLDCDRRAMADGLEVVGCWHSHPDHPARPSETDREKAWPGWSYVIVSVSRGGVRELRSWRLDGEHFKEETVSTWQP